MDVVFHVEAFKKRLFLLLNSLILSLNEFHMTEKLDFRVSTSQRQAQNNVTGVQRYFRRRYSLS